MQELVTLKNGNNIKVRDVEGKCVCIACRGFKTMWNILYWNSAALRTGGLLSYSVQQVCKKCDGLGFWTDKTVGVKAYRV